MNSKLRRNVGLQLGVTLLLGMVLAACVVYPPPDDARPTPSITIAPTDAEPEPSIAIAPADAEPTPSATPAPADAGPAPSTTRPPTAAEATPSMDIAQHLRPARLTAIATNGYEQALSGAMSWVENHPDEWTLSIVEDDPDDGFQRTAWSTSPCGDGDTPFISVEYRDAGTWIQFGVDCPRLQTATAQGIQEALRSFTLQSLPHGIEQPGWTVLILPLSSDVHEDVEILDVSQGRIKLSVHTELLGIFGYDARSHCLIADGPCLDRCCVGHDHRIPLKLEMDVGFDPNEILASEAN